MRDVGGWDQDGNEIHDLKTIDPVSISAVMWEGIQEAHNEILNLKDEIFKLKQEIKSLKNKND